MNKNQIAVQVNELTRAFGDFKAVDTISFQVKKGEIFGFLGANGAGKTTTIRMLCGLLLPTSGQAEVAGFDVYSEYEKIKLNMGMLWRERNILFGMAETSCRYLRPARYHQLIRIVTEIDALKEKILVLRHSINASTDDALMVEGYENRICLDVSDPKDFKAMDIPGDIYTILVNAKGEA